MSLSMRDIRNTLFSKELDNNVELKNNLYTLIMEYVNRQQYIFIFLGLLLGFSLGMFFGLSLASTIFQHTPMQTPINETYTIIKTTIY